MTVLRFDPNLRRFVDWKLVEVFPDATASVSAWRSIPVPPEKPEQDDTEDDDVTPTGTPSTESSSPESSSTGSPTHEVPAAETPEQ